MNSSSSGFNVSTLSYRDSYNTVVAKNVIVLTLGLIINYINGSLIHTFRKHQIFYVNPRYILFIHLVVNDMIQLTTSISLFVLSYIFYRINVSLCCLIMIFTVFTTLNTPLNLAVMAVECYIAICLPLRHAELCTIRRTYILIGLIWAMSAVPMLPDVFILLATEPVELFYSNIFCHRDNLFRHPIHLKKKEVSYAVYLVVVWLTLLYTYIKIILAAKTAKASKSADGDTNKARNTILLHGFQLLLCMLTYVAHLIRKALVYSFPENNQIIIFASYIIVQLLPRLVSPIVYGLRDNTFRQHLKKYLLCSMRPSIKHGPH
ncbi:odorant receptor 131-2-like [Anarrhichthys ocellatus]|uniref:odorant receptor 131-2-like n=1 Tax=Anarrhichthys ocellatus TaxID=433405 RepID=UPI0012EE11A7|nr:odorant receptor 131-2-like [Anarrhichthys ocellatus]